MSPLPSDLIDKLKKIRERIPSDIWLAVAAEFRVAEEPATGADAAKIAAPFLNPDQSWALRQTLRPYSFSSWIEIAVTFEVIDRWSLSSPRILDFVWSGPAHGIFPTRRIDQVIYDLLSNAKHRIFLVTFAAHRVPLFCSHLNDAIGRGVKVTLLLETIESSAGQLTHNASNAFKSINFANVDILTWPLKNRGLNRNGRPGKLHIKCAVVDDTTLIGSANLTDDAFNRNMELGLMVKSADYADELVGHFEKLRSSSILERT